MAHLEKGEVFLKGQFITSSNYTFFVKVIHNNLSLQAVYKPQKGQTPLWDFPPTTLVYRELAAFLLSDSLGWDLVPPTVIRLDGPYGSGSIQLFVAHNPERHYFSFNAHMKSKLRKVVLFDLIANNADRKGGHVILDNKDHLWLIDHGLCFHAEDKLRTVIWDFAGQPIPERFLKDIRCLQLRLKSSDMVHTKFSALLSPPELRALSRRINFILLDRKFPAPSQTRRSYPWPLV